MTLPPPPRRILMLGATGTIGRATALALDAAGHEVVCLVRPQSVDRARAMLGGRIVVRACDVTDPPSFTGEGICGEHFDTLVSCMASRNGTPRDAWAIDHDVHVLALEAAKAAGVGQFVLLSAICVQKPLLAFQHAKLAFEAKLTASGLVWSIVRPTAFFKSLSGQVERVRKGKPYLMFGDGTLTACKPISDGDLGAFIAGCVTDEARRNQVLPIGGPGDAITPKQQGEALFAMLGQVPRYKRVPVGMLDAIIAVLGTLGRIVPSLADKAELARIGRYYATESMLVLDPATGRYDAAATPSFGSETLADYHARLVRGEVEVERGEHAVF